MWVEISFCLAQVVVDTDSISLDSPGSEKNAKILTSCGVFALQTYY